MQTQILIRDSYFSGSCESMEVAMSKCSIESEDEQVLTRKEKEVEGFVFLPDDILLNILKRLPDAFLRDKAKYVCRRWFNIISHRIFLDPHASFILQNSGTMCGSELVYRVFHVDIREEGQGLQVKAQQIGRCIFSRSIIKSWCNHFYLIMHPSGKHTLSVLNIITEQRPFLPNCPASCVKLDYSNGRCEAALFFDKFKGIYKVVHLFMGPPIQCHILILDRDNYVSPVITSKWKEIQVPDSFMDFRVDHLAAIQVHGRYFHWDVSSSSNYLVSVDVVKEESFKTIGLPKRSGGSRKFFCSTLETDGFLTLIDGVSLGRADIWILGDVKMMKWVKLHSITLSDHYVKKYVGTSFLDPVCGVIRKNIIIFKSRHDISMFGYDLKTGILEELKIRLEYADCCVVPIHHHKV